jgi:hypothetical protein
MGGNVVRTEKQQDWRRIAEQASHEQDPAKLLELADKLDELLGDREDGKQNLPTVAGRPARF